MTTQELKEKMAVLMGGRAAEQLVFGEISTGAADDLDKISDIARHMVTRYGMDAATHQVVYDPQRQSFLGENGMPVARPRNYSEETAREIDLAIRQLVEGAFAEATRILEVRRADLDQGAEILLERETITSAELPMLRRQKLAA